MSFNERYANHDAKMQRRMPAYKEQIDHIQEILKRGEKTLKQGHFVKGLNIDWGEKQIPLSVRYRNRLNEDLAILRDKIILS